MIRITRLVPCTLALTLAVVSTDQIAQTKGEDRNILDIRLGQVEDARSHANVVIDDRAHEQNGTVSSMQIHVGNAQGGARSDVAAWQIRQRQQGEGAMQQMLIGNAAGSQRRRR